MQFLGGLGLLPCGAFKTRCMTGKKKERMTEIDRRYYEKESNIFIYILSSSITATYILGYRELGKRAGYRPFRQIASHYGAARLYRLMKFLCDPFSEQCGRLWRSPSPAFTWSHYRLRDHGDHPVLWIPSSSLPEQFNRGIELLVEAELTLGATLEVISETEVLLTIHEGKYHQVKRMLPLWVTKHRVTSCTHWSDYLRPTLNGDTLLTRECSSPDRLSCLAAGSEQESVTRELPGGNALVSLLSRRVSPPLTLAFDFCDARQRSYGKTTSNRSFVRFLLDHFGHQRQSSRKVYQCLKDFSNMYVVYFSGDFGYFGNLVWLEFYLMGVGAVCGTRYRDGCSGQSRPGQSLITAGTSVNAGANYLTAYTAGLAYGQLLHGPSVMLCGISLWYAAIDERDDQWYRSLNLFVRKVSGPCHQRDHIYQFRIVKKCVVTLTQSRVVAKWVCIRRLPAKCPFSYAFDTVRLDHRTLHCRNFCRHETAPHYTTSTSYSGSLEQVQHELFLIKALQTDQNRTAVYNRPDDFSRHFRLRYVGFRQKARKCVHRYLWCQPRRFGYLFGLNIVAMMIAVDIKLMGTLVDDHKVAWLLKATVQKDYGKELLYIALWQEVVVEHA
nr:DNA helicase II - Vibrio cholerae [Vibrio cholerae]